MMENATMEKTLESDMTPFFHILDQLENQLQTKGKALAKEIENLSVQTPLFWQGKEDFADSLYRIAWHKREEQERQRLINLNQKSRELDTLYNQHASMIILSYFKYLESPLTQSADLIRLQERYKKFSPEKIQKMSVHLFFSGILLNCTYLDKNLEDKFVKFSIKQFNFPLYTEYRGGDGNVVVHGQGCLLKARLITDPVLFSTCYKMGLSGIIEHLHPLTAVQDTFIFDQSSSPYRYANRNPEFLYSKESIIGRICTAVIFDNATLLRLFFEEYQTYRMDASLEDLIVKYVLVGLAAANGCIEVMKFFIEMGVNLEQKFIINTSQGYMNPQNILNHHTNSTLEMTALALALSAAPALPREKARLLIDNLLAAGANYNTKVTKTWSFEHGYYNNRQTSQRSSTMTLFAYDQTGILDELVKLQRASKTTPKKGSAKKTNMSLNDNSRTDAELRSELEMLKRKNDMLEKEVAHLRQENTDLKQEIKTLRSTVIQQPKKLMNNQSATIIQAAARGFFARKTYKENKKKIEQTVTTREKEIKTKLVEENKNDELIEFSQAIQRKDWVKAMEIIYHIDNFKNDFT